MERGELGDSPLLPDGICGELLLNSSGISKIRGADLREERPPNNSAKMNYARS